MDLVACVSQSCYNWLAYQGISVIADHGRSVIIDIPNMKYKLYISYMCIIFSTSRYTDIPSIVQSTSKSINYNL